MEKTNDSDRCPECEELLIDDTVCDKKIKRCRHQECVVKTRLKQILELEKGRQL